MGLYRSEYLWLGGNDDPTENEQTVAYTEAVKAAAALGPDARVVFRVLDIGGDKMMKGAVAREANPFLGNRSIRFLLSRRDIFRTQLRAILKASAAGKTAVLYTMVATIEELYQANAELRQAIEQLRGKWICEISELLALTKNKEQEAAKAYITVSSAEELRVLIAAASADTSEEIAKALGIAEADALRALREWEKRGIVILEGAEAAIAVEREIDTRPSYTGAEVARICAESDVKELIDVCAAILGKTFTPTEMESIIYLYDGLRFDFEYIVRLCKHCHDIGRSSIRYVEKVGIGLVADSERVEDDDKRAFHFIRSARKRAVPASSYR